MMCALCPNYHACRLRVDLSDENPTTMFVWAVLINGTCGRYGDITTKQDELWRYNDETRRIQI